MKPRAIFLFYHGHGHIIAFSKPARILEAAGYEVYFAGAGFFQTYVAQLGFKFYLLKSIPFGLGLEKWANIIRDNKRFYISSLRDRIKDKIFNERETEFFWMLEELNPELILIDTLQATDFIVLYRFLAERRIRIATINSMLPTQVFENHPPLNSDVIPSKGPTDSQEIRAMKNNQLKKRWISKLLQLGFDDQFLIERRLKKNSVSSRYVSKIPNLLNFAVADITEFILAPREFDFPYFRPATNQLYVGFLTDQSRYEPSTGEYEKVAPQIFTAGKACGMKLVYCSFGTVASRKKKIVLTLLRHLIELSTKVNYNLIISLKAQEELETSLAKTKGVYIFNSVPQLQVLKHADLFVTHGGLNSIKEAVYAEVPMLLFPLHPEYDPKGNAARAEYYGLGLRGNAAHSADELKSKIDELISNPFYKKNLREMKENDVHYTDEKFLTAVNALKPFDSPENIE